MHECVSNEKCVKIHVATHCLKAQIIFYVLGFISNFILKKCQTENKVNIYIKYVCRCGRNPLRAYLKTSSQRENNIR